METDDPRAALASPDVATQTAAARDLARMGELADLQALLERVRTSKSPSVRLYAAAAAAEILARHRGLYGHPTWADADREGILRDIAAVDPGATPSILLCYAPFSTPEVLRRLGRMLRDPRQAVRAGVTTALRRMALSGASMDDDALPAFVGALLEQRRLAPDARVDLVRLVGEAGWHRLRPVIEAQSRTPGPVQDAAHLALDRLAMRERPEAWEGIWVDEERDVLQLAEPRDGPWLVLGDVQPTDGELTIDGARARRIWAPRLGEEGSFEALQHRGRTYWRLAGDRLVGFIEERQHSLADHADAVPWMLAQLDERGNAAATRSAILLCVRTGRFEEALQRLERPLSTRRPRNDLHFLHGLAALGLGRREEGRAALARYLKKARKKEAWRTEAEALLAPPGSG